MRRWPIFAMVLLAAGCAAAQDGGNQLSAPPAALLAPPVAAGVCQIGPNDGPVVAERGIGGTGMPRPVIPASGGTKTAPPAGQDRGIGGTGLSSGSALASAGIAGEITGFASICVNGVEVKYGPATPIAVDGAITADNALRAGQIVAIAAARKQNGLLAQRMEIRHEVVGPVWAVTRQGFIVAGQRVVLTPKTRGSMGDKQGSWLAVSGLRKMNGTIVATRIDPAPIGDVIVHGMLEGTPGSYRIGSLLLHVAASDPGLKAGENVTATGTLLNGSLAVSTITPDLLYQNPTAYFGAAADWFLLEAYGTHANGEVQLAGGLRAPATTPPMAAAEGPNIFSFSRNASGGLQVQSVSVAHNPPVTPGAGPADTGMRGYANPGNVGSMPGQMLPMQGIGAVPGMGLGGGMGAPPH